ncbi:MAG: hypothetical protein Q8K75_07255 [Chlamydiales bacterium]|nr:hypothetical protein [Chlamydiales bacterium]
MIDAIKPSSIWPLAISSLGGLVGVAGGIAYRTAQGISVAHKHIRGVVPNNVCANGFSAMPLNIVNSGMQGFATSGLGIVARFAIPVGLFAAAAIPAWKANQEDRGGFRLGCMSFATLIMGAGWVIAQAKAAPALASNLGFTDDPSGHIIMMSAVGLSLGLADQCVRAYQEKTWTKLKVASTAAAVGFGLANAVFLFNTAACFHTVSEVFQGVTIIGALSAAFVLPYAFPRR